MNFRSVFFKCSWVLFFIFACLIVHESNYREYERDLKSLQGKVSLLEKEKKEAQLLNESLKLKILSQNDPAWVSLVLMDELGVIPEGQQKIVFKKSPD